MSRDPAEALRLLWRERLADVRYGWSIGGALASAEFSRAPDEPTDARETATALEIVTPRGALRLAPRADVTAAEAGSHTTAFCLARPPAIGGGAIRLLGMDRGALRAEDRDALLFDLGVGEDGLTMCVRTGAAALISALQEAEGGALFSSATAVQAILRHNPHRVMRSPLGRIEVYQPIPPAGSRSPDGPHTHLQPQPVEEDGHAPAPVLQPGQFAALMSHRHV